MIYYLRNREGSTVQAQSRNETTGKTGRTKQWETGQS